MLRVLRYCEQVVRYRYLHTAREISIPVPWGVIAGKEWGPPAGNPWLAVHGFLDNAGTFDTLLPLFPHNQRIVAIDYPGHGLSSHIPKGATYNELECIGYFERVAKYLGWEKFSFLGHSMGGNFGCLYASVFPEKLKCLVMLDVLGPAVHGDSREAKLVVEQTRRSISAMLEIEHKSENKPEKIYSTYEETLERLVEAAKAWNGEIPAESAQIILKRGLRENKEGYSFTRDIRLLLWSSSRSRLYGMPRSFYLELAKQISIPHLIVKGSTGPVFDSQEHNEEILELYKKNKLFDYQIVEGGHHVHLTHPQIVMPVIEKFMIANEL